MNIKKFVAKSNKDAIQMVKKEMGPDAVILGTKTIRSAGKFNAGICPQIEVTAAIDYEPNPSSIDQSPNMDSMVKQWQHMESDLKEIKEAILSSDLDSVLETENALNSALRSRYINFKTFGLNSGIIRELMNEYQGKRFKTQSSDSLVLKDTLSKVLMKIGIDKSSKGLKRKKVCAFIGPTGVGKTTTLAKLAAKNAIKMGKKTAMITLDTFRVAAVAQLETYARIMGIPMETAVNSHELQKAIQKHDDSDIILIDTAGKNPNLNKDMDELKNILNIDQEIHNYLVVSATTQYKNLLNFDTKFRTLPISSYIFTKLDEAQDVSSMVNFLISKERPVSFFTTGQQVPEDIEIASRKKLGLMILAGMNEFNEHYSNEVKKYGSSYRA